MEPTPYPEVNELLADLLARLNDELGNQVVGVYLFGSLATGEFEPEASDIDIIVLTSSALTAEQLERLRNVHLEIARLHPRWDNRIEAIYAIASAAAGYTQEHDLAVISPGEPFQVKRSEGDWLINRYVAREYGKPLTGPPLSTLLPPVPDSILQANIRRNAAEWREWITKTELIYQRRYQGHMIVTMCRELFRFRHHGQIASKRQAVRWAMEELPDWAPLIHQGLVWAREPWEHQVRSQDQCFLDTLRFVHMILDTILQERSEQ